MAEVARQTDTPLWVGGALMEACAFTWTHHADADHPSPSPNCMAIAGQKVAIDYYGPLSDILRNLTLQSGGRVVARLGKVEGKTAVLLSLAPTPNPDSED